MSISENNRRIAKNTMVLYVRMFVMMLISFFTAGITLNALGVEDYGINNVVGGLVAMFSLLSSSLTTASGRFITFALGKGDLEYQKRVFSTAVNIHIVLAIVVVIAIETVGVWFLNNRLNIPPDRLYAANWVLQCSVISFALGLFSVPYNSSIYAHERMSAFAWFIIYDAITKLIIIASIYYYGGDKLILLAIISLIPGVIKQIIYWIYCKRNFLESEYQFIWDKSIFKEMFSFSFWNFFGNTAYIFNTQGVNMLINIFFGVSFNAARGIATQIDSVVNQFTSNFTTAVNPQITKTYASNEHEYMHMLVRRTAVFSSYLSILLIVPLFLEINSILKLWLGTPPEYTAIFVRLSLISSLIITLGNSLLTAIFASGNIKRYQIIITLCGLWVFPFTYVAFKLGLPVESTYVIFCLVYLFLIFVRMYLAKTIIKLDVNLYFKEVIFKVLYISLLVSIVPLLIHIFTVESYLRLLYSIPLVVLNTIFVIYCFGLTQVEREYFLNMVKTILKKLRIWG